MPSSPLKKGTDSEPQASHTVENSVQRGACTLFQRPASQYPPVIVHVVHSLEGGGTERMLVSLLHGFDPARERHVVVTLRGAGSLAASLPDHVACRPIEAAGRSRSACLQLARVTREWKANVIHARNTGCWFDATVASLLTPGARLVLGFHGLETGRTFNRRQRRLARWGLYAGARFTSVSNAGKRQLCEQADIAAERIDVLRNGIDLRPFAALDSEARRETRHRYQLDDSKFVIGIVGSLTPVKQHTVLIRAVARAVCRVPTIRLMIVGDGPLRSTLADRAQAEGIAERVCFTGWRDDVPAMLAGMDAYACSSESEGMNNAVLEAMGAALPIVATDVGDNAVVLRNQREGLLVKPGSTGAMTEALVHLAGSARLRRRLAVAAQTRVKDYAIDQAISAYEQYYQTLTGGAARPAGSRSHRDGLMPGGTRVRHWSARSASAVALDRR